jgi:hypothetical protein
VARDGGGESRALRIGLGEAALQAAHGGERVGESRIRRVEAAAQLRFEVGFVELAAGRRRGRARRDADDRDGGARRAGR